MLVAHQDRPAPLGAEGDALDDAHRHQQDRGQDAHGGVGGQQADDKGGQTHHDQGGHQHRLAAELVAQVPADDPAQRAGGEPDTEGGERGQGAGQRAGAREERVPEVQGGGGAEPDEVVGLDDRADAGADATFLASLVPCTGPRMDKSGIAHELILSKALVRD